jgi:hypothetical protein
MSLPKGLYLANYRFSLDFEKNPFRVFNSSSSFLQASSIYHSLDTHLLQYQPFKEEAQTVLFKDPVRTAQ